MFMNNNKEVTTDQVMPKLDIEILAKMKEFQENFEILEIDEVIEIFKDNFYIHNKLDTDARQACIDVLNKMKEICVGVLASTT